MPGWKKNNNNKRAISAPLCTLKCVTCLVQYNHSFVSAHQPLCRTTSHLSDYLKAASREAVAPPRCPGGAPATPGGHSKDYLGAHSHDRGAAAPLPSAQVGRGLLCSHLPCSTALMRENIKKKKERKTQKCCFLSLCSGYTHVLLQEQRSLNIYTKSRRPSYEHMNTTESLLPALVRCLSTDEVPAILQLSS